jgi:hypothetical protein
MKDIWYLRISISTPDDEIYGWLLLRMITNNHNSRCKMGRDPFVRYILYSIKQATMLKATFFWNDQEMGQNNKIVEK